MLVCINRGGSRNARTGGAIGGAMEADGGAQLTTDKLVLLMLVMQ